MSRLVHRYPGWPGWLAGEHQPDIRPTGTRWYCVMAPFEVTIVKSTDTRLKEEDQVVVRVPAGFECDSASVPRMVWTISGLTPDGLIRAAAVTHDYLYDKLGQIGDLDLTREEADRIFLDLMLAAGMNSTRAKLAYKAVRWFGPRW